VNGAGSQRRSVSCLVREGGVPRAAFKRLFMRPVRAAPPIGTLPRPIELDSERARRAAAEPRRDSGGGSDAHHAAQPQSETNRIVAVHAAPQSADTPSADSVQ